MYWEKIFPRWVVSCSLSEFVAVIFFTKPNINPLKSIGPGLGNFVSNIINTFTDIVSYIRLFAVGLVTVALADTTNEMAALVGFDNILKVFGAIMILLLGHGLNMLLALLAILVHDIRLNVLEFSGHLNMEWSGVRFSPFKVTSKNNY